MGKNVSTLQPPPSSNPARLMMTTSAESSYKEIAVRAAPSAPRTQKYFSTDSDAAKTRVEYSKGEIHLEEIYSHIRGVYSFTKVSSVHFTLYHPLVFDHNPYIFGVIFVSDLFNGICRMHNNENCAELLVRLARFDELNPVNNITLFKVGPCELVLYSERYHSNSCTVSVQIYNATELKFQPIPEEIFFARHPHETVMGFETFCTRDSRLLVVKLGYGFALYSVGHGTKTSVLSPAERLGIYTQTTSLSSSRNYQRSVCRFTVHGDLLVDDPHLNENAVACFSLADLQKNIGTSEITPSKVICHSRDFLPKEMASSPDVKTGFIDNFCISPQGVVVLYQNPNRTVRSEHIFREPLSRNSYQAFFNNNYFAFNNNYFANLFSTLPLELCIVIVDYFFDLYPRIILDAMIENYLVARNRSTFANGMFNEAYRLRFAEIECRILRTLQMELRECRSYHAIAERIEAQFVPSGEKKEFGLRHFPFVQIIFGELRLLEPAEASQTNCRVNKAPR